MSRGIKYKAWYIDRMYYFVELTSYKDGSLGIEIGDNYSNLFTPKHKDKLSLIQFTELEDENEVDLDWWEGDILQVQDPEDKSICVIVWHDGGFKKQYYTDGKPCLTDDTNEEWFSLIMRLDKNGMFKKVGNIHSDPELLNGDLPPTKTKPCG